MSRSGVNAGDFNLREILAVTHLPAIILATLELDDLYLFTATVVEHSNGNFTAFKIRGANFHVCAFADHQDLVKFDRGTFFGFNFFNF
jgi:hypothetical protein